MAQHDNCQCNVQGLKNNLTCRNDRHKKTVVVPSDGQKSMQPYGYRCSRIQPDKATPSFQNQKPKPPSPGTYTPYRL
jgi:hypothetical protein